MTAPIFASKSWNIALTGDPHSETLAQASARRFAQVQLVADAERAVEVAAAVAARMAEYQRQEDAEIAAFRAGLAAARDEAAAEACYAAEAAAEPTKADVAAVVSPTPVVDGAMQVRVTYEGSIAAFRGEAGWAEVEAGDFAGKRTLRITLDCGEILRNARPASVVATGLVDIG